MGAAVAAAEPVDGNGVVPCFEMRILPGTRIRVGRLTLPGRSRPVITGRVGGRVSV